MVVLQRRFALLAALTIAAVSVVPAPADGAVVPMDYKDADAGGPRHSAHAQDLAHTGTADRPQSTGSGKGAKPKRHPEPISLPLPKPHVTARKSDQQSPDHKDKEVVVGKDRHDKDKRDKQEGSNVQYGEAAWRSAAEEAYTTRDMDAMNMSHQLSNRHDHRHDRHEDVIVNGDHDSVHMHRRSLASRVQARSPDNVIGVKGGALKPMPMNARRSPHRDHHHEVVVNGHDDHVHVHRSGNLEHRSPHDDHDHDDHDHHDHDHDDHDHHDDHDKVVVNGDDDHVDLLQREILPSVYVSNNNGSHYMLSHLRRDGAQVVGVPGSIDIMSQDPNSNITQKIASLVLSPANNSTDDDGNPTTSSFVLNASGSDHTQMYLAAIQDVDSTSSGNSTSSSTDNSTATGPSYVPVTLAVPVFDAEAAKMDLYCATFDPNPPKPSPLTMERCTSNGTSNDPHTSQVFAYEPGTGVIRPIWSTGSSNGPSNSTSTTTTSNSSSIATPSSATSTDSTATMSTASIPSAAAPTGTNLAQDIAKNLEEDWTEATRSPYGASARIFDASSYAQARNVTLVFTPETPVVASDKAIEDPSDSDDGVDGSQDTSDDSEGATGDSEDGSQSTSDSSDGSGTTSDPTPTATSAMSAGSSSVSATGTGTMTASTSAMAVFSIAADKVVSTTATLATSSAISTTVDAMTDTTTSAATDSASLTSTNSASQAPSLAVEVYEPDATGTTITDSNSMVASDSMITSASDASTSVVPTSSTAVFRRQTDLANGSDTTAMPTMSANAKSTAGFNATSSTSSVEVMATMAFPGRFREGTVVPNREMGNAL